VTIRNSHAVIVEGLHLRTGEDAAHPIALENTNDVVIRNRSATYEQVI